MLTGKRWRSTNSRSRGAKINSCFCFSQTTPPDFEIHWVFRRAGFGSGPSLALSRLTCVHSVGFYLYYVLQSFLVSFVVLHWLTTDSDSDLPDRSARYVGWMDVRQIQVATVLLSDMFLFFYTCQNSSCFLHTSQEKYVDTMRCERLFPACFIICFRPKFLVNCDTLTKLHLSPDIIWVKQEIEFVFGLFHSKDTRTHWETW